MKLERMAPVAVAAHSLASATGVGLATLLHALREGRHALVPNAVPNAVPNGWPHTLTHTPLATHEQPAPTRPGRRTRAGRGVGARRPHDSGHDRGHDRGQYGGQHRRHRLPAMLALPISTAQQLCMVLTPIAQVAALARPAAPGRAA